MIKSKLKLSHLKFIFTYICMLPVRINQPYKNMPGDVEGRFHSSYFKRP